MSGTGVTIAWRMTQGTSFFHSSYGGEEVAQIQTNNKCCNYQIIFWIFFAWNLFIESFLKKTLRCGNTRHLTPPVPPPPQAWILTGPLAWNHINYIISHHSAFSSLLRELHFMFYVFKPNFKASCLHLPWNRTSEKQFRLIPHEDSRWSVIRRLAYSGSHRIRQIFPARKDNHNLKLYFTSSDQASPTYKI